MRHLKRKLVAAAAAGAMILIPAAPANAYWTYWRADPNGGSWGASCQPYVEHHGNGWKTVKELRRPQIGYFYDAGWCEFTGYSKTMYGSQSFIMWY